MTSLEASTIAAINTMVSILWPVHNVYPHRTHPYLTQGLDRSGSKTWILDVCKHGTTHVVYGCLLIGFSQEYVNMGESSGAVALRYCTTSRKVAGSIPDSVSGILP